MGAMASQINSLTIVCTNVCSGTDQRKHQSSASLAFVRGIHRWPVNFPHKWPVTRKMFPFDDVIMQNRQPWCLMGNIAYLIEILEHFANVSGLENYCMLLKYYANNSNYNTSMQHIRFYSWDTRKITIIPQYCTCHDGSVVIICVNLWTDWIIRMMIKAKRICIGFDYGLLNTLRPRQMDVNLQTTFSNAFSWMQMFEFW